ncbi:S26 family signal peptidase [Streptomyces sp. NPDC002809]|uniref:S26 family signal peptidase n=1 Tax=Streptomyces sp. NPDC002809 TaxID=3154433 RepID=UPI003331C373
MTPWAFVATALTATAAVAVTGFAAVCVQVRRSRLRVTVAGESMAPALMPGQVVIARRVKSPGGLRTGDVVVLVKPERPGNWRWPAAGEGARLLKRLAALPGDPVPTPVASALGLSGPVPDGFAVVLGDNTTASVDSRDFGLVPVDRLLAHVPDAPPAAATLS